jgi:hypothetical protein
MKETVRSRIVGEPALLVLFVALVLLAIALHFHVR